MDEAWLDEVLPLPDHTALPHVMTRAEAMRFGVGGDVVDHRVRSGRWRRVAPGVYVTGRLVGDRDRAVAALRHGGSRSVLSGAARLRLAGFRSVRGVDRELLLVPVDAGCANRGRIQVRRTRRLPRVATVDGLRLAPVARAVADLALTLARADAVTAVVAEAVQRGLCTPDELLVEYHAGPRQGSALLRRTLADVGAGAHSVPEARVGRLLRRSRVPISCRSPATRCCMSPRPSFATARAFVALVRTWLDQLRWNRAPSPLRGLTRVDQVLFQ
jgi:hypothetical protein